MRQVEALLLLHMILGEHVGLRTGEVIEQAAFDHVALLDHAGRKEFDDERIGKAVDDEPRQAIALGMDDAIGIGDRVELQGVAPQACTARAILRAKNASSTASSGRPSARAAQCANGVVEYQRPANVLRGHNVDDAARVSAAGRVSRPSSGRSTDGSSAARSSADDGIVLAIFRRSSAMISRRLEPRRTRRRRASKRQIVTFEISGAGNIACIESVEQPY
jgi:hypothetical protein